MPLPIGHPYRVFTPGQLSATTPVASVSLSISGSNLVITWSSSVDALSYSVAVYSSSTASGTFAYVSTATVNAPTVTVSVALTTTNYYKAIVTVVGAISNSAPVSSGSISYVAGGFTPASPLSSGQYPYHWFKGDAGLTASSWTNYGVSGCNAYVVGTPTLSNYSQGGTQSGRTSNCATVGQNNRYQWTAPYYTSYGSVFGVFKLNQNITTGSNWTWLGNTSNNRNYTPQYSIYNNGSQYQEYLVSVGNFVAVTGYYTVNPATQFYTHSIVWNSTAAGSRVQIGSTITTLCNSPNWSSDYGIGTYDYQMIGGGSNPFNNSSWTMTVCEVIVYSTNGGTYGYAIDLTAGDVTNVQTYLSNKWGA